MYVYRSTEPIGLIFTEDRGLYSPLIYPASTRAIDSLDEEKPIFSSRNVHVRPRKQDGLSVGVKERIELKMSVCTKISTDKG